jgi:hypothetical protein
VFHAYYLYLKNSIEAFPQMTPNNFHTYRLLAKFCIDRHFIYITTHRDESKEELQSYYKLSNEDMEDIIKESPEEFLVPIEDAELSNPEIIRSPLVTQIEYDGHSSEKKKKKREEVQDIYNDEKENTLEESRPDSPTGGGGDGVNHEEGGE